MSTILELKKCLNLYTDELVTAGIDNLAVRGAGSENCSNSLRLEPKERVFFVAVIVV